MKHIALNRRQKISIICLVLFFLFMAVAAVIAENVYYDSLPVVSVGTPKEDHLKANYTVDGEIAYQKEDRKYFSEGDFRAVELLAEEGEQVTAGQELYRLDPDEVLLAQKKLELAVLQLEQETNSLGTDAVSRLKSEVNRLEIDRMNTQIQELESLYEKEGVVTAEKEGVVSYSAVNHSPVTAGQEIASVSCHTGNSFLSWQMPVEEGKNFFIGDEVNTTIAVEEITGEEVVEKNIPYQTKISQIEPLPQGQGYLFRARIEEERALSMEEGERVTLSCQTVSKESYPYVVPLSAIAFDENGTSGTVYIVKTRQRVFGEESYVIPYQVEVEYMLGNQAALMNFVEEEQIVTYSKVPLAENMAVKLRKD